MIWLPFHNQWKFSNTHIFKFLSLTNRLLGIIIIKSRFSVALMLRFWSLIYTEGYRSGHNGADSKHSRVCHDCISVNPLFIGVYATCICTLRILHLAVFSQFGKLALPLQFYMETYRSGHNGADSKFYSDLVVSSAGNPWYKRVFKIKNRIFFSVLSCFSLQKIFELKADRNIRRCTQVVEGSALEMR